MIILSSMIRTILLSVSPAVRTVWFLYALHELQRFYPKHFTLHAFTVDLGFGIQDFSGHKGLCEGFQVPLTIIPTEIGKIVLRPVKSPIHALCVRKCAKGAPKPLRQRPPDAIRSLYAHHKDDIIETMLLSLMFEGRFYTFPPKTFLTAQSLL